MWAVAIVAEHCRHIFGFKHRHNSNRGRHGRICFNESAVVENHVADGGAASVRTILPTGVGENGEIGIWDAMVKADVVDGVGGTIGIEFKSKVGAAAKVANEPGESWEVNNPRGDACFCTFADSKKDISPCVVGKVQKSTHNGAEGEASLFLFDKSKIRSCDWAIVLAENVVRRKGIIALREFGIWVVTLKGVQNKAVLIQGVGGILVLVDMHLEKLLDRSKEFDIKAIVPGIFKLLFDGIIATDVEHVVHKK
jgi:hypothetical protein